MRALAIALGSLLALAGCGSSPPATPDASIRDAGTTPDAGEAAAWRFEILAETTVSVLEQPRRVQQIRALRPDGGQSYLLYVAAPTTPAPLVVVNQPYAGIDWTGEEVDARWAALGAGTHPDVDAPAYDGDDVIAYGAQTVQQAVEECVVWLANGLACVHAYARFYAGGDLEGDALDASAGYHFAASRPGEIDLAHLGGFGGSWGGMMALFGAARAPEGARPASVVALYPPSDFVDLSAWSDEDLPAASPDPARVEAFYSTYWRRAEPAIGRPPLAGDPRAEAFRPRALCDALEGDVLVPHDDWDLLVPVRQTEALAAACPEHVRPLYWRRGEIDHASAAFDHGPIGAEPSPPSAFTFAIVHLARALAPDAAQHLSIGHRASLEVFLGLVRAADEGGEDVAWALPPLREIADAKTSLFDPASGAFTPGGDVLAAAVNAVWGTSYDASALRAQLELGLP